VAVAGTGGLAEIVEHGVTGVTFPPQDPDALATRVLAVLDDREYARPPARPATTRGGPPHALGGAAAAT
jgi:glycogen(starch) synthase